MFMPGANRADVKGLAMGSARSKGWTLVKSTDDLLVMQRPLDPASPTAVAIGASNSTIPPVIEVTSAFQDQSGGVNVAVAAVLISQPPGEKAPKRTDFTENYRDTATQSLESLRANWSRNQQRVANAMPTHATTPDETGAAASNPLVQVWGQALAEENASKGGKPVTATAVPTPTTPAPEPRLAPAPAAPTPSPPIRTATSPVPAPQPPSTPTPQRSVSGPAPVVDGSSTLAGNAAAAPTPAVRIAPPPATPEPVAPKDNMLTLSQAGGTGDWAYYAEQYARLRGCNVSDGGTQLIESRADGEIHKVSCVGADSYLLKCQNGVCRGLE